MLVCQVMGGRTLPSRPASEGYTAVHRGALVLSGGPSCLCLISFQVIKLISQVIADFADGEISQVRGAAGFARWQPCSAWPHVALPATANLHLLPLGDLATPSPPQAASLFDTSIDLPRYLDKSFYKTASLIAASCRSAAVFSECSTEGGCGWLGQCIGACSAGPWGTRGCCALPTLHEPAQTWLLVSGAWRPIRLTPVPPLAVLLPQSRRRCMRTASTWAWPSRWWMTSWTSRRWVQGCITCMCLRGRRWAGVCSVHCVCEVARLGMG